MYWEFNIKYFCIFAEKAGIWFSTSGLPLLFGVALIIT